MKLDFELSLPAFFSAPLPITLPNLFLFCPRVNLRSCLGEPLPVPASNRSEMTECDRKTARRELR